MSVPPVTTGASLTGSTVRVNVRTVVSVPPCVVPPSSCTVTVTCADPLRFGAVRKLSTPAVLTEGCAANSAALSFAVVTESDWSASSVGPGESVAHAADCAPASSGIVTAPPPSTTGASFTPRTSSTKVALVVSSPPFAVPPLSRTVTVTAAEPCASGAGVYVRTPAGLTEAACEEGRTVVCRRHRQCLLCLVGRAARANVAHASACGPPSSSTA